MKKLMLITAVLMMIFSANALSADAVAGEAKAASCTACHGQKGISSMGLYPNLAGQKEQYLAKQINDFRSGARKDPTMKQMVSPLSDDDVANIAAYYAGLE
ncbi:MAG: cytochrome C [Cycloclasticus sp. symbiont of Poecilosclerida sp. M]|nr:MAG: cytochrome C [Cycloclasticus sp. symbiont of Poecilosclerida sp. M]